jgi:thiamine biosynthesis lipoprotein
VTDALVDISGNMFALGSPADRHAWTIGVRDPRDRMPFVARVELSGRAVATSGTYEQFVDHDGKRYGHIIDPRSGTPAEGLISVTVLAPDAMTADGWSTALFVLGPEAARATAAHHDEFDAILIEPGDDRDVIWVERALEDTFSVIDDAVSLFEVRGF